MRKRPAREILPRQGVVLPETPRDRRDGAGLVEDLRSSPLRGSEVSLRLRNFRTDAAMYLGSLGGPLPFMQRLREIEERTAAIEDELSTARDQLLADGGDDAGRRWHEAVERFSFDEINDLIERHNRWYPIESRLPMDPRRGDYALVNGRDYRLRTLDAAWALERFPLTPAPST